MAVGFDATAFRSQLTYGGARPNLYEVVIAFPAEAGKASEKFTFMCRSTSLPGMQMGTVRVPYFGREIKLAGNRTFEDWNIRVFNDEDFLVRNAFEAWQNRLDLLDHATPAKENTMSAGGPAALYVDVVVTQLAKDSLTPLKKYTLKNAHPMNIGAIELAWDSNDQIEEFDVTFAYDYFVTEEISGMSVSV